jgi:hypothetical protein
MMTMTMMIQKGTEKNGMKKEREKTKKKQLCFSPCARVLFTDETVERRRENCLELFSGGEVESRRERVQNGFSEERISKKILEP